MLFQVTLSVLRSILIHNGNNVNYTVGLTFSTNSSFSSFAELHTSLDRETTIENNPFFKGTCWISHSLDRAVKGTVFNRTWRSKNGWSLEITSRTGNTYFHLLYVNFIYCNWFISFGWVSSKDALWSTKKSATVILNEHVSHLHI